MVYLQIRHQVTDIARWRTAMKGMSPQRKAAGEETCFYFQGAEDPSEVTVLCSWDTIERARAYAESDELRKGMADAGVDLAEVALYAKAGKI